MKDMKKEAIKAVHVRVDKAEVTDKLVTYIKEGLAPLGVNLLCIEFNPGYNFQCYPELANGTFGREHAQKVAAAAKEVGIRIVPLFMCLGHQGWRFGKNTLLQVHPEFDETPYIPEDGTVEDYPQRTFCCRCWCASNDEVYKYVFPMMDEIMEDFGADWLHVGMDEAFSLADDNCPRCKGKNRAELFARTVNILHDHVMKEKGWQMMMWADRLNDGEKYGYSAWDGDKLGTWPAADMIPTDILLTDWHYDMHKNGFKGIGALIEKGFSIIPAGWHHLPQTRYLLEDCLAQAEAHKEKGSKGSMAGMMITSWNTVSDEFIDTLMQGFKDHVQDEEDKRFIGIASSIIYMAEQLKDYQP